MKYFSLSLLILIFVIFSLNFNNHHPLPDKESGTTKNSIESNNILNVDNSQTLNEEKEEDQKTLIKKKDASLDVHPQSDALLESRAQMSASQVRVLDEGEILYKKFKEIYESEPFKFKVLNDGKDIIRARIHPKGDLIITHTAVEEIQQVMFDKDSYLEKTSSEMNELDNTSEAAAQNIDFVTSVVMPLSTEFDLTIYSFSCSASNCILLASYLEREKALEFVRAIENEERYVISWAYPIRHTNTEAIMLKFR
ncbi:hypothetical protein KIH87_18430 [Paraneptunicella aestuarii]|uniref:hypothetical protein n=1 Tax=Paraneptunicella aestuarii TaxID=2831148 RepID=UPI001E38DCA6|nr:hypothetical protein [Paraneptunicella aestuarii]UAA38613.1 hypothetical protein KIH87_18430 [Paraneptunicella aestuarii]